MACAYAFLLLPALAAYAGQADFLDPRTPADWDPTLARGKTRQIDFTTDEGTWMSVDTSPDGQWIVFDLLGHIYRVPSAGGQAECLTQSSGVALNYHPHYSPDGRKIAFVSDRAGQNSLWVMDADGTHPTGVFLDPITRISAPVWMPDGRSIIAVREFPTYSMHRRSARLWRFPVEGGAERAEELVGQQSGTQAYWPAISADGKALYYMQSTFAEALHGLQRYQHIRRLDFSTGRISLVSKPDSERHYWPGSSEELAPELSPDGKWLAFARRLPGAPLTYRGHTYFERTALWLRDLATGAEHVLRDPITLDMHDAHGMKSLGVLPGYAWAKDSRSLVLWDDGHIQRVALDGQATQIPFTARVQRTLSEQARWRQGVDERTVHARNIRWPTLSASTHQLVFETLGEIWIMDAERGNGVPQPLVPWSPDASYAMPEISPDGRQLVFVSWNDMALGDVWRCALPDCKPERLSPHSARYLYPTWDASGAAVFAVRSRSASAQQIVAQELVDYDLVRIDAQGEHVIRAGVAPVSFARGPEGRLFDVSSVGQVDPQLYLESGRPMPELAAIMQSIDPDQPGPPRLHLKFPSASRVAPSPDGRWVAYEEDFAIYLAPMRRDTAEYVEGESNAWRGAQSPLVTIKENPLHQVRRLADSGSFPRWVDATRVIYAEANRIHLFDSATRAEHVWPVDIRLPAAVPPKEAVVVLQGGRIVDVDRGAVIEKGDIVVAGSRIRCVGQCTAPAGAKIVSVVGKTMIPGLIDVHAHGYYEPAAALMPQHFSSSALYLAHGVTTTQDPASTSAAVFPLAEMIEAGRMVGPRTYSAGEPIIPQSPETGVMNYADAGITARRLAGMGAHTLKNFLQPRRDQRQMLGDWARKLGISITNEGADLYYDVSAALDGHTGFEHPLQYMAMYRDVIQFFARAQVVYSPTLNVAGGGLWAEEYRASRADPWRNPKLRRFLPWQSLLAHTTGAVRQKDEYTFPFLAEAVKDLRAAGGFAAIGGHGEMNGLDSHWELWNYAEAQTPMQVLTMGSMGGARMIGLEHETGSIAVGKLADIVVLDKNPLDDIHNSVEIHSVMKGGVLYDGETLDEIWPAAHSYGTGPWYDGSVFRDTAAPMH